MKLNDDAAACTQSGVKSDNKVLDPVRAKIAARSGLLLIN